MSVTPSIKNRWILGTCIAYFAGIVASALALILTYLVMGVGEHLLVAQGIVALSGVAFSGLGLMCMAMAHNSPQLITLDGVGKQLAVFGWSLLIVWTAGSIGQVLSLEIRFYILCAAALIVLPFMLCVGVFAYVKKQGRRTPRETKR
ncbi:hypothetical protein [Leucobacter sp. 1207-22]|uniref:hypothetical protein n=1 Tax=Leucobacter sp. 1207-22 TaxID=2604456 RepID=UPI0040628100